VGRVEVDDKGGLGALESVGLAAVRAALQAVEGDQCLEPEALPWADASSIWGPGLERVSMLICRLTVQD
jgi:hypothetical protein